jgi:glc operon protein GlcG
MSTLTLAIRSGVMVLALGVASVDAQPPYGVSISLDLAQRCVTAATAEAKKNEWNVVISVLDAGGHPVLLQRMDGAHLGSLKVAHEKARTAVSFRRPTKVFEEVVKGEGGLRLLTVSDLIAVEGGLPIVHDGHVIGGVGVSGATAQQDGQIAQACVSALQ